jgi:hypothetical protein
VSAFYQQTQTMSLNRYEVLPVGEVMPVSIADRLVGDLACRHVQSAGDSGEPVESALDSVVGQSHRITERDVGQRVCGGVRDGAEHVGHAVEDAVVDLVRGFLVGGGVRVFKAAALVHCGVGAGDPCTEDHDFGGADARNAAVQHPLPRPAP